MITNQDDLVVGIIGSYSIENELRDRGELGLLQFSVT